MTFELTSWRDGAAKRAIIDFVSAVTAEGGDDYVAPDDRLAVFDNDGTLWSERPMYFQLLFAIDRVHEMAPEHPEWAETQPFQAILEEDRETSAKFGMDELSELVAVTHTGLTTQEFTEIVDAWISSTRHPSTGKLYTEMIFQPMLELLHYLRRHDFTTYIVSGGGADFMRVWSEEIYGIPTQQVIGTTVKTEYEVRDGEPVLERLPVLDHFDDEAGKPVGIHRYIGRRPILAFGNSDGDQEMLQWTHAGEGLRFCGLVHHTDAEREWAYDRGAHVGGLDEAWDEALEKGWTLVDMKEDWKRVFPIAVE